MKRGLTILFSLLILIVSVSASEIEIKESETINKAIDLLYNEKFEEAKAIFNYVKDNYPDHPIGYFYLGFYYNFLAAFYETDKFDSKIILYYNLAEKKSRFHLEYDPDNAWYSYYIGSCLINKGYLMGRDGSKFSGIRKTVDGISYIEDAIEKDKDLGDAYILLGSYRYYKSSLMHWVYDRRTAATFMIRNNINKCLYSKYAAISSLGWIYIDYEKYSDAEEIADTALDEYPDSHLFIFLKARALFEQNKFYESNLLYHELENKLNKFQKTYSNIDIFNTYYFLTRGYFSQGNMEMCQKYLKLALNCRLDADQTDRLEDRIEELEDIKDDLE